MTADEREGKITPIPKIKFPIKVPQDSILKDTLYFLMSNFNFLIMLFIWIYYMINPCLLSMPFIIYIFSFQLISSRRLTSAVLLYIFFIIVFAQCVILSEATDQVWVAYFFYSPTPGVYNFATGYLFFLFIMIFVN